MSRGMNQEDVVAIYKGILLSHIKEIKLNHCRYVDRPRVCHTE